LVSWWLWLFSAAIPAAEDRRERVLSDRREVQADARWIYNDLPLALRGKQQSPASRCWSSFDAALTGLPHFRRTGCFVMIQKSPT